MRLRCYGVLVCFDGVRAEDGAGGVVVGVAGDGFEEGEERGVVGVDGGDDGEVVLELVEVVFAGGRGGDGVIEGILEGGVVWAEGHFADDVGEIECCRCG